MTHISGKVDLCLFDKDGNIKHKKTRHNTITELGKMATLTRGLAGLADYCDLYGAAVAKGRETGDESTVKPEGGTVKIVLTSKTATELAGKSYEALEDSEVLGYATTATSASSNPKEGIRVAARNAQLAMTVASQTRAGMRFSWSGIEGNLNTIGMFIPPLSITHLADSTDTTSPDYTSLYTQFIPGGQADVPANCIAIGSSKNKLLNLETLTLADFTPGSTSLKATVAGRCAFNWGDYIITFTPMQGEIDSYNQSAQPPVSFNAAAIPPITVYNKVTGASYTTEIGSSFVVYGFTVNNNKLYVIGKDTDVKVYECTVTDTAITTSNTSPYTLIVKQEWISQQTGYFGAYNDYGFVPIQIADKYYTYCINTYLNYGEDVNYTHDCYIVSNLSTQAPDEKYLAPHVYGCNYYSNSNVLQGVGGVYLNSTYYIKSEGMYISPAEQFGNLFSYFDLAETWAIAAADTLQISYYYELEDRA